MTLKARFRPGDYISDGQIVARVDGVVIRGRDCQDVRYLVRPGLLHGALSPTEYEWRDAEVKAVEQPVRAERTGWKDEPREVPRMAPGRL